jgi:hypothetical protein
VAARFASNLIVLIAGCFLAAATFALDAETVGWLGLGCGVLIAVTVLAAFATRGRGVVQRSLDCALALLAAWTIVASRCFSGATLAWLMFASGAGAALLAVEGLIAHEVVMEVSLRRAAAGEPGASSTDDGLARQPAAMRVAG